ncbi:Acetyltransferase, GNAT family [Hyella patelloides LEGE 07179]|uniref:Acetyltransferase, GNAT family n=1 Tax=Hyella patelloides LEGE 07179 TaxID=945734 RepID=A0A563W023_9CYAN|nr:GNAT family N-acetyltransferase [Hyella patelloides]VEP17026.1 Acetyltransferase, GNAT family [Hyella patelloides LEGE 07179]
MMKNNEVVRLERSQINQASTIAAKAFEDDPVFGYLTPEAQQSRLKALTWLTKNALEYCYYYGHIYTTSDLKGIAAWLPPEKSSFAGIQQLQLILQLRLYLLPFKCGWNKLGRWLSFLKITEDYHERDMQTQPHWYLALMFVNPSYQRQGVGSVLLKPILDRSDDEKLQCYVLTFTEQAVKFYQRNGFSIIRKSQASKNAPFFWNLKRDTFA